MALKSETASPPNGMVNVINQERCSNFFVQNSLGDEHFIFPQYIYILFTPCSNDECFQRFKM